MLPTPPTLHMICGKIAAGKSTLAAQLAQESHAILISEDAWLSALFADEMTSLADYARCATKLRSVMAPHVVSLLARGVSVVLDFPANTKETRRWMRDTLEQTNARHMLHVLDVPDAICLARLRKRNANGSHPFAVTKEQFHQVTKHFIAPSPEEGFTLVMHMQPD